LCKVVRKIKTFFVDSDGTYRSNISEIKEGSMCQKILYIILTCLVFNTGLIISAVVHSEAPIKVDEQTGRYLDNLGAGQHRQTSVSYHFEQHGSQYSKDSMNQRNNSIEQHGSQYSKDSMNQRNSPRWDAVVFNLRDTSGQRVYLRETKNNRNAPSGTYGSSGRYNQVHNPGEEPENRPVLLVPIKEW
jgi:hypothetical protein